MHTAICTFENRAQAEQAVERLQQAGFARHDIHLEHRRADGSPMEERSNYGMGTFEFFEHLFGHGEHAVHAGRYNDAVEQGLFVVMVEHQDEDESSRAQAVLHGLEGRDMNRLHRAGERPLRDLVVERGDRDLERSFGTARADMDASHDADVSGAPADVPPERALERPIASNGGWGEQDRLQVVDDDRPIASPSLHSDEKDKPR
jgi:hypothetical protein